VNPKNEAAELDKQWNRASKGGRGKRKRGEVSSEGSSPRKARATPMKRNAK